VLYWAAPGKLTETIFMGKGHKDLSLASQMLGIGWEVKGIEGK
jgi:hypothetical protein